MEVLLTIFLVTLVMASTLLLSLKLGERDNPRRPSDYQLTIGMLRIIVGMVFDRALLLVSPLCRPVLRRMSKDR